MSGRSVTAFEMAINIRIETTLLTHTSSLSLSVARRMISDTESSAVFAVLGVRRKSSTRINQSTSSDMLVKRARSHVWLREYISIEKSRELQMNRVDKIGSQHYDAVFYCIARIEVSR